MDSLSDPILINRSFSHKPPRKTVGRPKRVLKNKPKPKPLFNDIDDNVLSEPSQLLTEASQKTSTPLAKVLGRGDKVRALDTIPEMLEGKHGYPDATWRLGELVHVSVSE